MARGNFGRSEGRTEGEGSESENLGILAPKEGPCMGTDKGDTEDGDL